MTDTTPEAPAPVAAPVATVVVPPSATPTVVVVPAAAPVAVAKPWYAQISNYAGVAVGIVGNVLPYLTPDFLTSIGVSATASHTIGSIVAVILLAYKEKAKPSTPSEQSK